jgi:hypothetical protein
MTHPSQTLGRRHLNAEKHGRHAPSRETCIPSFCVPSFCVSFNITVEVSFSSV